MQAIFQTNRPSVTQSTINTYMSCIRRVAKDSPDITLKDPDDFVTHVDSVLNTLKAYTPTIRKTKLSAIVVFLDDKKKTHSKELVSALEKYRKQMTTDMKTSDASDVEQTLTDRQKENYIEWDEVMKIYNELKTEAEPLFKIPTLSNRQFFLLQKYVILSCYVLIPPRRSEDYCSFKIHNVTENATDCNYMLAPANKKKKSSFVFNVYKNAGKLGKQVVEIPTELKQIINKWKLKNENDWLMVNNKFEKTNQSQMTSILNSIFGKKISSSLLRHIYLTKKYGNVDLAEMENTAKDMGSSQIKTILTYVSKAKPRSEAPTESGTTTESKS
jgi:hypothetical protein